MKEERYIMFRKRNGKFGVVEAVKFSDFWVLIDTWRDLDYNLYNTFVWEKIGRENVVGLFISFESLEKFLRDLLNEEIIWV